MDGDVGDNLRQVLSDIFREFVTEERFFVKEMPVYERRFEDQFFRFMNNRIREIQELPPVADIHKCECAAKELQLQAQRHMQISRPPYPPVPAPSIHPTEVEKAIPPTSGIYFFWSREGIIEYVGQSASLRKRISANHHALLKGDRISYVEVPIKELDWAECYYIYATRPRRNYGDKARRNG